MPGHALRFGKHGEDLINRMMYQNEKERVKSYWKQQYKNRAEGKEWTGQEQRECILMFGPTAVGKTTEANMKAYNEYGEEDNVFENHTTNGGVITQMKNTSSLMNTEVNKPSTISSN